MDKIPKNKLKDTKKAQSSVDFFLTYGWALLLVAILIILLFSFGVLKPILSECNLPVGFDCVTAHLSTNGIVQLELTQSSGVLPQTITAIGCVTNQTTIYNQNFKPFTIQPGQSVNVTIQCYNGNQKLSGQIGTQFHGYIVINYTNPQSKLSHVNFGVILHNIDTNSLSLSNSGPNPNNNPPGGTPIIITKDPGSCGTIISPANGTYAPGSNILISVQTNPDCLFINWTCSGTDCYHGINTTANIPVTNTPITENAIFLNLSQPGSSGGPGGTYYCTSPSTCGNTPSNGIIYNTSLMVNACAYLPQVSGYGYYYDSPFTNVGRYCEFNSTSSFWSKAVAAICVAPDGTFELPSTYNGKNINYSFGLTAAPTCNLGNMPFNFIDWSINGGYGPGNYTSPQDSIHIPPSAIATAYYYREVPNVTFYNIHGPDNITNTYCSTLNNFSGSSTYVTPIPYGAMNWQSPGILSVSLFGTVQGVPNVIAYIQDSNGTYSSITQNNHYFEFCEQNNGYSGPLAYEFLGWVGQGQNSYSGPNPYFVLNDIKTNIKETAQWGPAVSEMVAQIPNGWYCDSNVSGGVNDSGGTYTYEGFYPIGHIITGSGPVNCEWSSTGGRGGTLIGAGGWENAQYMEPTGNGWECGGSGTISATGNAIYMASMSYDYQFNSQWTQPPYATLTPCGSQNYWAPAPGA